MKQGEIDETAVYKPEDNYIYPEKRTRDLIALYGERDSSDVQGKRKDRSEVGKRKRWSCRELTARWKGLCHKVLYKTEFGRRLRGWHDFAKGYGIYRVLNVFFIVAGFYCMILLLNMFV